MQKTFGRDKAHLQQIDRRKAAAVSQNVKAVDRLHRIVRFQTRFDQFFEKGARAHGLVPGFLARAHAVAQKQVIPFAHAETRAVVPGDI